MSRSWLLLFCAPLLPRVALAASSVDAGGPYTVPAFGSTTLTATGTTNSLGCSAANFQYRWDFTNNGSMDTSFTTTRTATFSATGMDGPMTVTSKVEADPGAGACFDGNVFDTATVNVQNVPPDVTSISVPGTVNEGASANFTATFTDPETMDTHTTKWNFGDGTGDNAGSVTQAHVFADDGNFVAKATVTDDDGGTDVFSVNVAVANVAPTITSKSIPTSGAEGSTIPFSLVATDPGADVLTTTWSWGDGTPDGSGASATHVFVDEGSYSVVATVDDGDGGSKTTSGTVVITNAAPVLQPIGGPATGGQAQDLTFTASYTDPGSTDLTSIRWDFGDGVIALSGSSQTHAYLAQGTYTVSVTVCDDFLPPACDTKTKVVTIDNTSPTADLTGPAVGLEGEDLAYACAGSDPGGDPLTWDWAWGDTKSTLNGGDAQSHVFVDEGSYAIACTVKDNTGSSAVDTLNVVVSNVAPAVTGTPATTVVDGLTYSFTPGVSDPGADDKHVYGVEGPVGMTIDGSTHEIRWPTTWHDLGKHPVTVTIVDDDGGRGELEFELEVTMLDADVDAMSDNWEAENGLDAASAADAALDPDGDGRDNLLEWNDLTDPQVYDGPSVPVPLAPIGGEDAAASKVQLQVENATSPDGETLTYTFEVFADSGMSTLIARGTSVANGSDGSTEWEIDATLSENTAYHWWAAASDRYTIGEFSTPTSFFRNSANEAPTAPSVSLPMDGSTTADLTPVLILGPASDPDGDAITYSFRLTKADGTPVDSEDGVPGDDVVGATFASDTPLTDGLEYCVSGFATDDNALAGPSSAESCFSVDTSNEAPSAPVIVSPADDSVVTSLTPEIQVTPGVDPEGRGTSHHFELDTSPGYDSADLQVADVETSGTTVTFTPDALLEDTTYHLRVLANDGAATSAWAELTFFVNAANGLPSVPGLANPGEGAAFADDGTLEVVNATDPEGEELHYQFFVKDDRGTEVIAADDVAEDASGSTGWAPGPLEPGLYTWSAQAIDASGGASGFAPERSFEVLGGDDTGETGETGDTGDDKKCGCSTPGAASSGLLLGLLGLVLARRSRRA